MRLVINTDGASKNNPGPASIGAIIKDIQGNPVSTISRSIGKTTNNQAEYWAIIAALEAAIKLGANEVEILSDSELVVRQLNGQYRLKNASLKPLHQRVKLLASKLKSFAITSIPREENKEADRLANLALE